MHINHKFFFSEGCLLIQTFDLDIKNINWNVDTFEVNNCPGKGDEIDGNGEIYDKDWKPFLRPMVMDELPPGPFYQNWTSMDKFAPSCMKSQIASKLKVTLTLGESPCHSISVMPFLSFQHICNETMDCQAIQCQNCRYLKKKKRNNFEHN